MQSQNSQLKKDSFWLTLVNFAIPQQPTASNLSLQEIELYRRIRLTSIVLLFGYLFTFMSVPSAIFGSQASLKYILVIQFILVSIAFYLNRRKHWIMAGLIFSVEFTWSIWQFILSTPGGLSPGTLEALTLMVIPEMIVVSLLPSWCVFIEAALNIGFVLVALAVMPLAPDLKAHLADAYSYGVVGTAGSQIIVAILTFLWTRSNSQALKRANRAEEIVRLQRTLSERDRAIAQQKQQLEASIYQIEVMLEQVANGNVKARIPLSKENILWSIAGKLNNLMSRFQRTIAAERYLQLTHAEIARLAEVVHRSKRTNVRIHAPCRGTPVDGLILELNGTCITSGGSRPAVDAPDYLMPSRSPLYRPRSGEAPK
jgi:hypothetical protein